MTGLISQTKRNFQLFFKDRGMFISSLITPIILLVLYVTFLAGVYRDGFSAAFLPGMEIPETLLNATVGGQLVSSLLAVSCVTVAFCSNLLMVQDKATGAIRDLTVSPAKPAMLGLSYFLGSAAATLLITFAGYLACLLYLLKIGFYMSAADIALTALDVFLLTLFGVSFSSCVNFFLSTQGQASAVGTVVSSGYGFVCGAYLSISTFPKALQRILMFLPGTYGTSLIRNHCMAGVFREWEKIGFPPEGIEELRKAVDCQLSFFGKSVGIPALYLVLGGSVLLFIGIYIGLHVAASHKR